MAGGFVLKDFSDGVALCLNSHDEQQIPLCLEAFGVMESLCKTSESMLRTAGSPLVSLGYSGADEETLWRRDGRR